MPRVLIQPRKRKPARERLRAPVHPGPMAASILDELHVSARQAAIAMGGMTPAGLGKVLNGKAPVTAETALRFGVYFGNGPALWLGLQADHDLWHKAEAIRTELDKITPLKNKAR
jgi:antitoxin HigA-1